MTRREFAKQTSLALAGATFLPNAIGKVLITNEPTVNDWATRMIYFVMIDRFSDGNTANNDQGAGEYDPANNDFFQGGDLAGIRKRLPYIQSLGFDALWITPPVHNTVADAESGAKTYHGYAAYDFMAVDPHFGTLSEYKALVQEAHALGIKVIQDIVVNHTGNFIGLSSTSNQGAPNDPVFRQNDPNNPEHRAAAIYHFNPPITDYANREQTLTHSLATLDDLNLNTPAARQRMLEIYRYWIQEVGVDGFRIDTVYYTPPEFYDYFMYNADPENPGIKPFAEKLGKPDFFVFAETWKTDIKDYPLLEEYLVSPSGKPRIDSSIDFPLNTAFSKVFFEQAATRILADSLAVKRTNAPLWVNFVDNHDVERMFNRAPWEAIQQALVCMFTLPGIPCVYYGTENGFKVTRKNMFDDKYYTVKSEGATLLKKLTALRKNTPAFALGKAEIVQASGQNGVVAYTSSYDKIQWLTVFNTSTVQKYFVLPTENEFEDVFTNFSMAERRQNFIILEPSAFAVLRQSGISKPIQSGFEIKRFDKPSFEDNATFEISFGTPPALQKAAFSLLFNDNVENYQPFTFSEAAIQQAKPAKNEPYPCKFKVFASDLLPGENTLRIMATTDKGTVFSNAIDVQISEHFERLTRIAIPEDQQRGVDDNLRPPTEPSYGGQITLEAITVWESIRHLKVELLMQQVTDAWNPPNGFDHVYFHLMFDLPNTSSDITFLPGLRHSIPDFTFDRGYMASGWSMVAHTDEGAKPDAFGKRVPASIRAEVDKTKRTVSLLVPKSDLVQPGASLRGTKIFVATWDGYLDELRGIKPAPDEWNFSVKDGADPAKLAKIFSFGLLEL